MWCGDYSREAQRFCWAIAAPRAIQVCRTAHLHHDVLTAAMQISHHSVLPGSGQFDGSEPAARLLVERAQHRIDTGRGEQQRLGRHHHVHRLAGRRNLQPRSAG